MDQDRRAQVLRGLEEIEQFGGVEVPVVDVGPDLDPRETEVEDASNLAIAFRIVPR